MADRTFPFRCDKRYRVLWWPFGVREGKPGVTLTDDGRFLARFGPAKLETTLDNIDGAHITTDYSWFKAIGVRLSFADDGLTFGTCTDRGVCVHFVDPVKGPIPLQKHTALTVTVEDAEGLVEALGEAPVAD